MSGRPGRALAAAALLVAFTAAGCGTSSYARRERVDRQLNVAVRDRLASTAELSTARIDAKSHAGVVALLGEAPDEDCRLAAERVAVAVPGVVRVNNMILVVKSASKTEGSSPAQGALFISRAD